MNAEEIIKELNKAIPNAKYIEKQESKNSYLRQYTFGNESTIFLYSINDKEAIESAHFYSNTSNYLDLQCQEIIDIITKIESLERLVLEGRIMVSSYDVSKLKNIKELHIDNLNYEDTELNGLENLKLLKKFHLSLHYFPKEVLSLPVEEFELMHASSIHEEIGEMNNLKMFSFMESNAKSVPESIGELSNLEELYLGNNKLEMLPESIGDLNNLKTLMLFNNKLKSLPNSIIKLEKLENINLDRNKIKSLPGSFFKMPNLKSIKLEDIEICYGKN